VHLITPEDPNQVVNNETPLDLRGQGTPC
jgi:hypothetical protein